jgi:hypothetical protein
VRSVRGAAARLRGRHKQDEGWPRHGWKAERIRGGADKDLRRDGSARFLLVIDDGTGTVGPYGVVLIMTRQMRMKRLTVMMLGLVGVEMHVQERRAERACLNKHDEGGGGQPTKHRGIVAKDQRPGT